jgi:uncharacterized protein YprB with RNaseH-like and TPR domain
MASNLKDRLSRIRGLKKDELAVEKKAYPGSDVPQIPLEGWEQAGYLAAKKVFESDFLPYLPTVFPQALPIVIPDLARCACGDGPPLELSPADLLFFDLETTGLSGGAGTLAFLAAFGRLIPKAPCFSVLKNSYDKAHDTAHPAGQVLRITQYLLLDYPGESDFLQALLPEFSGRPLVVSYNGKSFDSQILKSRCLMNRMQPPEYLHADLLHPARRLWKRLLENCSQGTIEEKALGIDRSGDIPGALAPEIWFDFLHSGRTEGLFGICGHNRKDIQGLASIFAAMSQIATDPIGALEKFVFDAELLALRWRDTLRRNMPQATTGGDLQDAGKSILRYAADKGAGRAALVYAKDLLRASIFDEGRERLSRIACGSFPPETKAAALRSLSLDSERRLGNAREALALTEQALELLPPESPHWKECERRRQRLSRLDL